jgi:hypothetical protein
VRTVRQGLAEKATVVLSRLLLLLVLLLPHALPEPTLETTPDHPPGALLVLADQSPAIRLQETPRAATSQPQDDGPALRASNAAIQVVASIALHAGWQHPFPATPALDVYLRPFAQGPPPV